MEPIQPFGPRSRRMTSSYSGELMLSAQVTLLITATSCGNTVTALRCSCVICHIFSIIDKNLARHNLI